MPTGIGDPGAAGTSLRVEWTDLILAETAAEYGETALSVEDCIEKLGKAGELAERPTIVFLVGDIEGRKELRVQNQVFGSLNVWIALSRFNCLRAETDKMPLCALKKRYEKLGLAIFLFDPAGKLVREIKGKRVRSKSHVGSSIEKTWDTSFTMKLGVYGKKLKELFGRRAKIQGKQRRFTSKLELSEKDQKALELLLQQEAGIDEEVRALKKSCAVRPQFLEADAAAAKAG